MNFPIIDHPTNRPNFYKIRTDQCLYWYSYKTCIAFQSKGTLTIRENDWNVTTGKHLNFINPDKSLRIDGDSFEQILAGVQ